MLVLFMAVHHALKVGAANQDRHVSCTDIPRTSLAFIISAQNDTSHVQLNIL